MTRHTKLNGRNMAVLSEASGAATAHMAFEDVHGKHRDRIECTFDRRCTRCRKAHKYWQPLKTCLEMPVPSFIHKQDCIKHGLGSTRKYHVRELSPLFLFPMNAPHMTTSVGFDYVALCAYVKLVCTMPMLSRPVLHDEFSTICFSWSEPLTRRHKFLRVAPLLFQGCSCVTDFVRVYGGRSFFLLLEACC